MSNLLSAEQPAEPIAAEGQGEVFATLISTDARPVRLANGVNGELIIRVGENKPVVLDQFQHAAAALALGARK